jgi:hypothetical protein
MRRTILYTATVMETVGVFVFGGTAGDRGDTGGDAHGGAGGLWPGRRAGDGRVPVHLLPEQAQDLLPAPGLWHHQGDVSPPARGPRGLGQAGGARAQPTRRDGTSEHECIRGLGGRFIKRISGNPSGYYVDVHNDAFSYGAIRDQLTQGKPR